MKLIINADDFGYSRGHNYGILDCMLNGSVSATTLLMTTPGTEHALQLIKENPSLDIGIHLSLDIGRPLLDSKDVSTLIDADGNFKTYDFFQKKLNVDQKEIYQEWKAQIDYAIENGVDPSHIDSHHHIHMKEDVLDIYLKLAKEYQLAIRFNAEYLNEETLKIFRPKIKGIPAADYFSNDFYQEGVSYDFFKDISKQEAEVAEVMCHPAYLDHQIIKNSSYVEERVLEQEILSSPKTKELIEELGMELISFKDLPVQ